MSQISEILRTDHKTGILYRPDTFDAWIINESKSYFPLGLKEDDTILDLGGHIGAFAVRARIEKWVKIVSIEAEQTNYSILACNAYKFNFTAIYGAIVDDKLDGQPIKVYVNTLKNNALHSIVPVRGRVEQTTAGIGFKRLLKGLDPTIIKCDIEGGEYGLCWNDIRNTNVRIVIMELHLTHKGHREAAPGICLVLEDMGFKAVRAPRIGAKNWTTLGRFER
jgi:FkbM family methyltransferase